MSRARTSEDCDVNNGHFATSDYNNAMNAVSLHRRRKAITDGGLRKGLSPAFLAIGTGDIVGDGVVPFPLKQMMLDAGLLPYALSS